MFAVIKTGGKQYRVKEGDILEVEDLGLKNAREFDFDRVLLIEDGSRVILGTPFITSAAVRATVLENVKDEKVLVFKKKRRKQYRRLRGHRQRLVRVQVDEIVPDLAAAPERKPRQVEEKKLPPAAPVKEAAPAAAKKEGKPEPKRKPTEKKVREVKPAAKGAKPAKPAKKEEKAEKKPAKKPAPAKEMGKKKKSSK